MKHCQIIYQGLFVLCLLFLTASLQAQSPEQQFEVANAAYQSEKYTEAIDLYEAILAEGYRSPETYYNLANAYYRNQQIPNAILNYERALMLNPGHEDSKYNLSLARRRVIDNIEPMPDLILEQWTRETFRSRSASQWAGLAVWMMWLALAAGAAFLLVKIPLIRRISFFGGIGMVLLAVLFFILSMQRMDLESDSQEGIIFDPNVYVKDAPDGRTDLIILHAGVKVAVVDSLQNWYNIRVEDANTGQIEGWVPTSSLVKI